MSISRRPPARRRMRPPLARVTDRTFSSPPGPPTRPSPLPNGRLRAHDSDLYEAPLGKVGAMPPPRPHESIPLRDTSLSPPTSPRAASTGRPRHHSRQSSTGYPPSASGSESWQARPSQQASRSSYYAADQTTGGRYRDEEAISQQQQQQHHQGSRGGRPPSARAAGGNGRRWDQEEDDSDDGYGAPEGGGEDDWDAYAGLSG